MVIIDLMSFTKICSYLRLDFWSNDKVLVSSLVGTLRFVWSVAIPLSMSMGLVSQPGEDPSLACKKLVVSVAGGLLSSSMETISMVIWFSTIHDH